MISVSVYSVHQLVAKMLVVWRWVQTASEWMIFLVTMACCQLWRKLIIRSPTSLHTIYSNKMLSSTHTQFEIGPEPYRKSSVIPHSDTEVLLRQQLQGSSQEIDVSEGRMVTGPSIYIEQACGEPQGQQLVVDFSPQAADHEVEIRNQVYDLAESSLESESTEITSESEVETKMVRGQGDCRKPRGFGGLGSHRDHTTMTSETESSVDHFAFNSRSDFVTGIGGRLLVEPAVHRTVIVDMESSCTEMEIKSQVFHSTESFPTSVPESTSIKMAAPSSFIIVDDPKSCLGKGLKKHRKPVYVSGESQIEITTRIHTYESFEFNGVINKDIDEKQLMGVLVWRQERENVFPAIHTTRKDDSRESAI